MFLKLTVNNRAYTTFNLPCSRSKGSCSLIIDEEHKKKFSSFNNGLSMKTTVDFYIGIVYFMPMARRIEYFTKMFKRACLVKFIKNKFKILASLFELAASLHACTQFSVRSLRNKPRDCNPYAWLHQAARSVIFYRLKRRKLKRERGNVVTRCKWLYVGSRHFSVKKVIFYWSFL
jgi:hypothetical protein